MIWTSKQHSKHQFPDQNTQQMDIRASIDQPLISIFSFYRYGDTSLILAARNGHLNVVKLLLSKNPEVNVKNNAGETAIIIPAKKGFLDIVQALVEHGADVNTQQNVGYNALLFAALSGKLPVVKYLVEVGRANLQAKTKDCGSPLHNAALNGYLSTVKYLVENGARVDAITTSGEIPLHFASFRDKLSTVVYLVEEGGSDPGMGNNFF